MILRQSGTCESFLTSTSGLQGAQTVLSSKLNARCWSLQNDELHQVKLPSNSMRSDNLNLSRTKGHLMCIAVEQQPHVRLADSSVNSLPFG